MQVALFQADEVLLAGDLQAGFQGINQSFQTFINVGDFPADTLLTGGQVMANSPATSCVQLSGLVGIQGRNLLQVPSAIQINILGSSCAYGSGEAAGNSPRIDLVCIQYDAPTTNETTREFINPVTQAQTTQVIPTTQMDSFSIQVVHGTPSSSPVAPAIPSGWWGLAQIAVAANATTISSSDITDLSSTYRTDGGHLALTSQGLLQWVNASTVSMPSGSTFQIGATTLTDSSGDLTIGAGNQLIATIPVQLSYSGLALVLKPSVNPSSPADLMQIQTAGGTKTGSWRSDGQLTTQDVAITGLTGATVASRYVGGTSGGAPTTGTFLVGDFTVDASSHTVWICTTAGSPGSWVKASPSLATPSTAGIVEIVASPAVGDPLVPSITDQTLEQELTTTSATTLASYTPSATGFYNVLIFYRIVTASTTVTLAITYTDAGNSAQKDTLVNAVTQSVGDYAAVDRIVSAGGQPITVNITAGTANQIYASAVIEGV